MAGLEQVHRFPRLVPLNKISPWRTGATNAALSLTHCFYAPPLIRAELLREAIFLSGRHQLRIGYLLLMVRPGGLSFVFRKGPTSSHTDGLRFFTQESTVFSLDSFTFSMTTNDPHPHVRTCAKRAQTGVDRTEIDEAKGRCGRRRRKLFAQPKL